MNNQTQSMLLRLFPETIVGAVVAALLIVVGNITGGLWLADAVHPIVGLLWLSIGFAYLSAWKAVNEGGRMGSDGVSREKQKRILDWTTWVVTAVAVATIVTLVVVAVIT